MIPLSEFIRDYEDHKEEIILDIMQSQHLDRKTAERGYKVSLADSVEAGIVAGDIDPDK